MARVFKQLTGVKTYRPWKDWEIEDCVVGKLIRVDKDQYRKNAYVIEVESVTFADEDLATTIMSGSTPFVLNSVGIVDRQYEDGNFEIGDVLMVTYKGVSEMTKGPNAGEEAHSIEVSVADGEDEVVEEGAEEGDEFGGL